MTEAEQSLIYLLSCAINSLQPERDAVLEMDLQAVYALAKKNSVCGAAFVALDAADVQAPQFHSAYLKAVRRSILFDLERSAIFETFEQQGIWYLPLKGTVMKELYPKNGMREMADCDVLFDAGRQNDVYEIMLRRGYTAKVFGKSKHDIYFKPPVYNFEMHTALFEKKTESLFRYYSDPAHLLRKDADNRYGYHLSDEDFYVLMMAHEWKHYHGNGVGIRSLMDCYLYLKSKGDRLDWEYIDKQMTLLQISDFEHVRRTLAQKVFASPARAELEAEEEALLQDYFAAGTYGSLEYSVHRSLRRTSKPAFLLKTMFPSVSELRKNVSFVNRCPLLYPAGVIYRWGRVLLIRRNDLLKFVRAICSNDYKKI